METDDGQVFLLGRMVEPERPRIPDGRRGRGRQPPAHPGFVTDTPDTDDDLPPMEP
ncbi:hypothetical protein [Methylorubrum extorquens]|nr:hypothetical protein [Methylorubrum extorquens]